MKRGRAAFLVAVGAFVYAASAHAAPETTKVESSRAAGPQTSGQTPTSTGGPAVGAATADETIQSENRLNAQAVNRLWTVSAGAEIHSALVRNELDGGSRALPSKFYDYYFLAPGVYPTQYDYVRLGMGLFQYYVADQGESGLRLSDMALSYTRYIPIATENGITPSTAPMRGVLLGAEGTVTAPTSFTSQKRGMITVPRLRIFGERAFLNRSLITSLSLSGEHYFARYRSAEGGSPNPLGRIVTEATVDYRMPFHRPLSFGALVDLSYVWYYGADTSTPLPYGNVGSASYPQQPIQQGYGWEIHARYALPTLYDVRTSASLAYSLGDNAVLHDGVQHMYYAFYRRASEVYLTLSGRY